MNDSKIDKVKQPHFIGIGGIGISSLARMFLLQGATVSGSDTSESTLIRDLEKMGVKIFIGHRVKNIHAECDLVIYTQALQEDNVELVEARKKKIRTLSYPEVLGLLSKDKFTIAISGTHGKTTTTAMIFKIMIDARLDPTVIVGSLVKDSKGNQTNFISGKSNYLVMEVCEYKRSFIQVDPNVIVITNVGDDHLDYYQNIEGIEQGFRDFVNKLPARGVVVANLNLPRVANVLKNMGRTILDYSSFGEKVELQIPGEHNRENARAAVAVASILNISEEKALESLKNFESPWRRFEYKGSTKNGALVYDDYAHNPAKVAALISGAREKFPDKKIVVVFQPHLFSRTKQQLDQFAESFSEADRVIITPIYPSREAFDPTISHSILAEAVKTSNTVKQVETANSLDDAVRMLGSEGKETVFLTVGAGDIYTVAVKILLTY